MNNTPTSKLQCAPGAALPALGINFNALKRSFCFGLLASVHVRDHVWAVVREKLQRSTTANSIVPCSTFFAAHHRVSKKEFSLSGYAKTSLHLSKILRIDSLWRLQSASIFFVTAEELFYMCVLTLCEWLIIRLNFNPIRHEGWYFYLLVIFGSDFVRWFFIKTFQTFEVIIDINRDILTPFPA